MSVATGHEATALDRGQYDVSTYDVLPPELPAPEPERPRLLLLGTALASLAVIAGFATLLGVYLSQRAQVIATGETWLPDGVTIPLTQPNFMGVTLAMSVVAMAWAVYASSNRDRANTLIAVGLTLLFGFCYVSQTFFLLAIMEIPIRDSGMQGWLIWSIVGSHVALALAAMGYVAVMGLRTVGGSLSPRDREGILGAAMFWIVTVGVYFVIWYAIYITK